MSRRTRAAGFTLIELLVTLAVAVLLLGVAVPSFRTAVASAQATAASNDLLLAIQFARSEAIRRNADVEVCPSSDQASCVNSTDWSGGWLVRQPGTGELLRVQGAVPGAAAASGPSRVRYTTAGYLQPLVAPAPFVVQVGAEPAGRRALCLSAAGKAEVRRGLTC